MELAGVGRRIERIRGRIRRLFLLDGLGRLLFALGLLLVLSYLLDVFLELPLTVRYASFGVALAVLLVVLGRFVLFPLSVEIGDDDLALAAEARAPELRDRLISALQFQRRLDDPENAESRVMMESVIEEAGDLVDRLESSRLLDARRAARPLGFAAIPAVVLLLLLLVAPGTFGTWVRRNLILADIPWPRATTLVVLNFPETRELVVTRGETVRVEVQAQGEVPDDVEIWFSSTEDAEGPPTSRRMFQTESEPDRFQFEFRQVPGSFRFWVEGGDDDDGEPVYTVRALISPTLTEIRAHVTYPPYTGLPEETFREADLDLPTGSRVTLDLVANMPLAAATFVPEDGAERPLALGPDGRTMRHELVADRSFRFSLRLVGEDGQRNLPDSATFRIRAVPDRKPLARVLYPASRPWLTLNAIVPMKVLASDNFGVARLSLFFRKGVEGEFAERPFTPDELSTEPGAKELVGYTTIPVPDLQSDQENPVRVGDEIVFFAESADNNGNTDRTDRYRIEVVSEEELANRLSQRQSALRLDALRVRRDEQEPAREEVDGILEFLAQAGELESRDRDRFRQLLVRQGTVTRQMERFFRNVAEVFNAWIYNRVTNPPATERVLATFDAFLSEDHEDLSTVFKKELYQRIIEDYRAGNVRDQQVLAVLIEILEIALRISEENSPEATRLLGLLAKGESEQGPREDLLRVRDLQTRILADFDLLDTKMREWETYAGIIQLVREILNTEQKIRSGAESLNR